MFSFLDRIVRCLRQRFFDVLALSNLTKGSSTLLSKALLRFICRAWSRCTMPFSCIECCSPGWHMLPAVEDLLCSLTMRIVKLVEAMAHVCQRFALFVLFWWLVQRQDDAEQRACLKLQHSTDMSGMSPIAHHSLCRDSHSARRTARPLLCVSTVRPLPRSLRSH